MKQVLRKIFAPILSLFEEQEGAFVYKPSHRLILKVVGCLFFILSIASLGASIEAGQLGALLPVIVFFAVGLVMTSCGPTKKAIERQRKIDSVVSTAREFTGTTYLYGGVTQKGIDL